jgi:hypothetical protein
MEEDTQFDLNDVFDHWIKANCSRDKLTSSDIYEIREHMLFTIEDLMDEKGLSEVEAFAVAQVRFGSEADWGGEMQLMNKENFQLRKIVSLLAGFLMYFLFQNLLFSSAALLMIVLESYTENTQAGNILIMHFYIYGCYIITIGIFIIMALNKKRVLNYLSEIKIRYFHSVAFVILLVGVFFARRILLYKGGDFLNDGNAEFWIFKQTLSSITYIYPFIFSVGFLLIWFYYDKQNPQN